MRKKQESLFGTEDLDAKCSLAGLLETPLDSFGEFYDEPLLDRIKTACIEYQVETERLFPERFYYRFLKNGKLGGKNGKGDASFSDTTKLVDAAPEEQGPEFNFQRKIQPWDTLDALTRDLGGGALDRNVVIGGRRKQSLIVIASLIDKVPNLGGLARTCEIFGADTLVVPSKTVCDNKLFKQVSVTADKWVNIEECPPDALYDKLSELQSRGFALVGVEQTAQSTSLEAYTFPERTVLLLGREKTGIPSRFIHMLDACVEIPQLGIIRSLNVHVSGALMVWEYTRQQILKRTASGNM
jgi:tRNA guanosine-2'-O-methyltransferase